MELAFHIEIKKKADMRRFAISARGISKNPVECHFPFVGRNRTVSRPEEGEVLFASPQSPELGSALILRRNLAC